MKICKLTIAVSVYLISTGANAALLERLDGLAYYDTEADLTWLADANMGGMMGWSEANDWAATLNISGVTGWRLPETVDVGNDGVTPNSVFIELPGVDAGYNITSPSEMSNMYYNVLGNTAYVDENAHNIGCSSPDSAPEYCLENTGPFSNIQTSLYWSSTGDVTHSGYAWYFEMMTGYQWTANTGIQGYAWAVHTGDVSAVPVPAAVWLFGSGLLALAGLAKHKKTSI
ncbi:MAG: hypothetical protein OQK46_02245 [Gammaproteobacteria bacterium]|nr:hypothetical protein [Gammaproteobacteria bacterium]